MRASTKEKIITLIIYFYGLFNRFFSKAYRTYNYILNFIDEPCWMLNKQVHTSVTTEIVGFAFKTIYRRPVFINSKPDK